jgi:hypothetical protein
VCAWTSSLPGAYPSDYQGMRCIAWVFLSASKNTKYMSDIYRCVQWVSLPSDLIIISIFTGETRM